MKRFLVAVSAIVLSLSSVKSMSYDEWKKYEWHVDPRVDPIRGSIVSYDFLFNARFFGIEKSGRLVLPYSGEKFNASVSSFKDVSSNPIIDLIIQLWPSVGPNLNYQGQNSLFQYFSEIDSSNTSLRIIDIIVGMLRIANECKVRKETFKSLRRMLLEGLPQTTLINSGPFQTKIRKIIKDIGISINYEEAGRYPENTTIDIINAYAWQVISGERNVEYYREKLEQYFPQKIEGSFSSTFAQQISKDQNKLPQKRYIPWRFNTLAINNDTLQYNGREVTDCVETSIRLFLCNLFYNANDNAAKIAAREEMFKQIGGKFGDFFLKYHKDLQTLASDGSYNLRIEWLDALYEGVSFDMTRGLHADWNVILHVICEKLKNYMPSEEIAALESPENKNAIITRMQKAKARINEINRVKCIVPRNELFTENGKETIRGILQDICGIRPDCAIEVQSTLDDDPQINIELAMMPIIGSSTEQEAKANRFTFVVAHETHAQINLPKLVTDINYPLAASFAEYIYNYKSGGIELDKNLRDLAFFAYPLTSSRDFSNRILQQYLMDGKSPVNMYELLSKNILFPAGLANMFLNSYSAVLAANGLCNSIDFLRAWGKTIVYMFEYVQNSHVLCGLFTPVHLAVLKAHETGMKIDEKLKLFDDVTRDNIKLIDLQDNFGRSPLHWALILGDRETSKILVSKGATLVDETIELSNFLGIQGTLLSISDTLESLKRVLESNNVLNFERLWREAQESNETIANINNIHDFLGIAIRKNNPTMWNCLIAKGAQLDGRYALYCAVDTNALEICKILLDSGVPVDTKIAWGVTPLAYVVDRLGADGEKIGKFLISRGASLNETNHGKTVKEMAEEKGLTWFSFDIVLYRHSPFLLPIGQHS